MPCPPGYCSGAADCGDLHCEGHPKNAAFAKFLDKLEADYREPIGYEAATPPSYLPRDAAMQIDYAGPEPLLPAWALYVGVAIMVTLAAWAVL